MTKQQEILKYLATVEQANKRAIYENVSFSYYHNWQKYIGEILARMIVTKTIERVRIGVYRIKPHLQEQADLFNN